MTTALGTRHPIIQGPFGGGLSTVALAALVSNRGGLGSYGAHMLAPSRIEDIARELRASTSQPFALNLWVSDHDDGGYPIDDATFERAWQAFAPYFRELGLSKPEKPDRAHPAFDEQIEALIDVAPPVASFVFGIPPKRVMQALKARGTLTVGAATTLAEALALDDAGFDAIVATGFEAGGHRPSFLTSAEESLHGTFALVQLVARRVRAAVIAAGGIVDANGARAARALGAAYAQLGTAFLACKESGTTDAHRDALLAASSDVARTTPPTTLTRAFSGRLARGLANAWTREWEVKPKAPFPLQSWFAGMLRAPALAAGRTDLISLWAGQVVPNLEHRSADALMDALVAGLDRTSHRTTRRTA